MAAAKTPKKCLPSTSKTSRPQKNSKSPIGIPIVMEVISRRRRRPLTLNMCFLSRCYSIGMWICRLYSLREKVFSQVRRSWSCGRCLARRWRVFIPGKSKNLEFFNLTNFQGIQTPNYAKDTGLSPDKTPDPGVKFIQNNINISHKRPDPSWKLKTRAIESLENRVEPVWASYLKLKRDHYCNTKIKKEGVKIKFYKNGTNFGAKFEDRLEKLKRKREKNKGELNL